MKKGLLWVSVMLGAGIVFAAVFFRLHGATASVRLPDRHLDEVTSVTFRYADGSTFTPSNINKDFLHVINLWEIDEIISDTLARALRSEAPIRLTLKHNRKTLYQKKGYLHHGAFFLDAGRQGLYKMRCDYLSRTWPDFFVAGSPLWRNAILIDLDYFDIQRVAITTYPDSATYVILRQDVADTINYTLSRTGQPDKVIPTAQAQAYLTAFKQVYYDDIVKGCDTLAPALYTLHIQTLTGQAYSFTIHPHTLFKAHLTTQPQAIPAAQPQAPATSRRPATPPAQPAADTLLVPHAPLDKILTLTRL